MKVRVFRLLYKNDGAGGLMAVDGDLYALAVKYAAENIAKPINLLDYANTWLACEVDQDDKPMRALGILCMVMRPDFPICRFTDNAACKRLVDRANDFLHDQGWRGSEATVHIAADETPEQRCPNYLEWMRAFGLTPADRYFIKVR